MSKGKVAAGGLAAVLALSAVVIAKWEGVRYTAYLDPIGIPTVCYGHTGPDIVLGKKYTKAECDALLDEDMREANGHVRRCVARQMPISVEAAFTSLVFNVGPRGVCNSTLGRLAKDGEWYAACAQLPLWKYAGGRVYRGLVLRRADEMALCVRDL